jgi:outer membrane cobalamin receptor
MGSNKMPKRQRRRIKTEERSRAPVMTPLAAAVITALYPVGSAIAQDDQDPAAGAEIEEIVVTGSRIRKDTFTSAAPMDVVLAESAQARGITDVATLLQTTTVAAGSPQVTAAQSAAGPVSVNGGLGTSTISLRGLGANRTLVLLNGRRAGPSGIQGSVSSFDLNNIPLAAIERVEILKDGASSIYGSDAVAGVVNIITKKDDGGAVDVFYSAPTRRQRNQVANNFASVVHGASNMIADISALRPITTKAKYFSAAIGITSDARRIIPLIQLRVSALI